jgi:hypothetical protein
MLARFGGRPTPPLPWSAYAPKTDIAAASDQVSFGQTADAWLVWEADQMPAMAATAHRFRRSGSLIAQDPSLA